MKAVILSLGLFLPGLFIQAQTRTATVYCQVQPTLTGVVIDYADLSQFLPDSLTSTVLTDYKKDYRLRNRDLENILLLMATDGWKLTSTYHLVPQNTTIYILSRDIVLDEASYQQYRQKIKARLRRN